MDFEEALALIEKMENGADLISAIKDRLSKVNSEAKSLRIRTKKAEKDLEDLKANNPLKEILKESGVEIDFDDEEIDLKEQVSSFVKSLKENKSPEKDVTKSSDYIKLQKQVEKLLKQNENNEKEKQDLLIKTQKNEIKNKLLNAFSSEIMNGDTVLDLLIESVKNPFVIENSEVGFKLPDGEIVTGIEQIMEEYKKMYPKQILNKQKSGIDGGIPKSDYKVPNKFTDISQIRNLKAEQIAEMEKSQPEQYKQMMEVIKASSGQF